MLTEYIKIVLNKKNLSLEESKEAMRILMSGNADNISISAFLTALKMKGEQPEELAGFISVIRENSMRLNREFPEAIDVCGTGGDDSGSFNISTATSFVVAGAGVRVAKHGNRSISSKTGSADVLTELGVNIHMDIETSQKALEEIGITFLFAPDYHPAMRHVAEVRRTLAVKTVFNLLGPLANPAGVKKQIIGTYSNESMKTMFNSLSFLDNERVSVICSEGRYDEITLTGKTKIMEYDANQSREYTLHPKDFGFDKIDPSKIKGGDSKTNAKIILDILEGNIKSETYQVVIANAALALYTENGRSDLKYYVRAAEESVRSGQALQKLNELIELGISK